MVTRSKNLNKVAIGSSRAHRRTWCLGKFKLIFDCNVLYACCYIDISHVFTAESEQYTEAAIGDPWPLVGAIRSSATRSISITGPTAHISTAEPSNCSFSGKRD